MSDTTTEGQQQPQEGAQEPAKVPETAPQTFSQADVDKIVKERVQREKTKYADYDQLKEKAGQSTTLEERVAGLEAATKTAEQRALRAEIANAHGISADDRDLFLTGDDEEALTAQAKRLTDRASERKNTGNHVPREGNNPQPTDDPLRTFAGQLFKGD